MKYTAEEIIQYVREDDVKFIRLAFCDVFGRQKNISIMPEELPRAFTHGIAIDGSSIRGFGDETRSDLLLHPDPSTLMQLPWRPEHGKVLLMYTTITCPDGTAFPCDTRSLLMKAVKTAQDAGCRFAFGSEQEFYLFLLDEDGNPTQIPYDHATYMDIAPEDKGENVRREICLTLEKMGIYPESSHHEEGPGQNEIDFRYSDALQAADNAMTFQNVVRTTAYRSGLYASFSPKPLENAPGNGFHINMSVNENKSEETFRHMIAGVLNKISEITVFLNPEKESYKRLGFFKAPKYISWSRENRSQLVRIPAADGEFRRMELRSPDPSANPYLAFALLIYAGLYGIQNKLELPEPADLNLYTADVSTLLQYDSLPGSRSEAVRRCRDSAFVEQYIPRRILDIYSAGKQN